MGAGDGGVIRTAQWEPDLEGLSCSAAGPQRNLENKYVHLFLLSLSDPLMLPCIGGTQQDLASGRLWVLSMQMSLSPRPQAGMGPDFRQDPQRGMGKWRISNTSPGLQPS